MNRKFAKCHLREYLRRERCTMCIPRAPHGADYRSSRTLYQSSASIALKFESLRLPRSKYRDLQCRGCILKTTYCTPFAKSTTSIRTSTRRNDESDESIPRPRAKRKSPLYWCQLASQIDVGRFWFPIPRCISNSVRDVN